MWLLEFATTEHFTYFLFIFISETKTIKEEPDLCSDIAPDDVIIKEKVDTNETPCGKGDSFSEGPPCKDSITKHENKNQCLDGSNSHEENLQNYSQTSFLKEQKSGRINQGKRQFSQRVRVFTFIFLLFCVYLFYVDFSRYRGKELG